MGFFTLEAARIVGPRGRIIAADIQAKMLDVLRRRAERAEALEGRNVDAPGTMELTMHTAMSIFVRSK
jgi:ubiquinone/menaquinone biosynthesis C-methylase UbiE